MVTTLALIDGRYRIDREIGVGGMARVYAGTDMLLGRKVAIKLPDLGNDAVAHQRFLREARAAARLTHPNIVTVFDAGDDPPYLVMELVDGEALDTRLRRLGMLPPAEAIAIVRQIAEALGVAHNAGIVHRDVKSANVLLVDDRALLADFGIAQSIGDRPISSTNTVFGTVQYLAPERALGEKAIPASDVYSLGIVLFELLTGGRPFDHDNPIATAKAHVEDPLPRPRDRNPSIPATIEAVLMRALAKNPVDRYQTGGEFAAALRAIEANSQSSTDAASGLPFVSPPTTPTEIVEPMSHARKRRLWPLAAALIAAVLIVGAVFATVAMAAGARGTNAASKPADAPKADAVLPATTLVPSVAGMTIADATKTLNAAGFTIAEADGIADAAAAGTVIRQDPPAGNRAATGSVITLVPSRGPATPVPPAANPPTAAPVVNPPANPPAANPPSHGPPPKQDDDKGKKKD